MISRPKDCLKSVKRKLAEYTLRFEEKFKDLEVVPCMLLFTEHHRAVNFYKNKYLTFSFHLIKMWELEAESYINAGTGVLPFIPLMKNGLKFVENVEERIYSDKRAIEEKADLLDFSGDIDRIKG